VGGNYVETEIIRMKENQKKEYQNETDEEVKRR